MLIFETILILGMSYVFQTNFGLWVFNSTSIYSLISLILVSFVQILISAEEHIKKTDTTIKKGYRKLIRASNFLYAILLTAGIIALFTNANVFGFTMIIGLMIDGLLINSIASKSFRNV